MEALATLSLVCNITQLVEQGLSIAQIYKQVRIAGLSSEYQRLQDLMTIAATVDEAYSNLNSPQPLHSIDSQIKDIAIKSIMISRELKRCLHDVMYKDEAGVFPRSPANTLMQTLRRRPNISELYKEYERLQLALQTSLLRNVHHLLLQIRDEHTEELIKISATNDAVRRLLEGDSRMAATASAAIQKFKKSYEESMQRLERTMEALVQEERRRSAQDRLLKCLDFDGRLDRVDQIEARVGQNHETARWIFVDPDRQMFDEHFASRSHTPDDKCGTGDDQGYGAVSADTYEATSNYFQRTQMDRVRLRFTDWLRNGSGIFHLSGKAGSGKSSLMAYIHRELLVNGLGHEHLLHWKQGVPLIVLSFFFFNPSLNELLKTSKGLWRSLCFQILSTEPKLVQAARTDAQAPHGLHNSLRGTGTLETRWRSHELLQWFIYLVKKTKSKFLVLLDGLDELEEYSDGDRGQSELLNCLERTTDQCDNIKFLCASRADQPFKRRLSKYPSLKLQDVNYHEIRLFCRKELATTRAADFVDEIADRAEGVFLWAWLVAKDLAKAAARNASNVELRLRLDACPASMNQLYEHMLEQQDRVYKGSPQPFLRLIEFAHTHGEMLTAFELLLSTIPEPTLANAVTSVFDNALVFELNERAAGFEEEVILRCAGLVEFQASEYFAQRQAFSASKVGIERLRHLLDLEVSFVHRSALDFLHEEGRKFLEQVHLHDHDAARILGLAHVGHLCLDDSSLLQTSHEPRPYYSCGREPLRYAALFPDAVQYDVYDSFEARIRDNLLARNMFSHHEDAFEFMDLKFWHSELPSWINLAVSLSMRYGTCFFDNHAVPLIQSLDAGAQSAAAAYALCHVWSRSPKPVAARMCDLLALTPPTTIVRWRTNTTVECSLWQHFVSWGFWQIFKSTRSCQLPIELTRQFLEQGADSNADLVATFQIFGARYMSISALIQTESTRTGQIDDDFLVRGKSSSLLLDLTSSEGIALFSTSVATSWRPRCLARLIDFSLTTEDIDEILVQPFFKRPSDPRGSAFSTWSRWSSITIASLNDNLPSFSQDDLDSLRKGGYGVHEGAVCHHWSADSCPTCGYEEG